MTVKGAPDVLIERCSHFVTDAGAISPLTNSVKVALEQLKNTYSSQGKRCLLLARKIIPYGTISSQSGSTENEKALLEHAKSGVTLVGLVAIVDPLRPEIRDVVHTLRGAGIRIAMVTGDFALTALAIAREAGIVTAETADDASALSRFPDSDSDDLKATKSKKSKHGLPTIHRGAIVLSGPDLMTLSEHQWVTLTEYEEIVFARTTPEQKLRIVREFQRENVVAMTGDGVNDAPSLKAADVGISLGGASDIAMEAADMILLESFSSVVVALQYGRVVFDNLKKVCAPVFVMRPGN